MTDTKNIKSASHSDTSKHTSEKYDKSGGARAHASDSQLSRSTQRAQWVNSPDEHEEHPGKTLATSSQEVIQRWAEDRKAQPATIAEDDAKRPRVLRFDFPGYGGESLRAISWDARFRTFDERDLVFLFQEHQQAGNQSNFFHLDSPDREHD